MSENDPVVSNTTHSIPAPFLCLWLALWPVIAVILGLVFGAAFCVLMTFAVFGLTLVRTPMHIIKMLYVTATTKECFKGHLARPMRVAVLPFVPIVHILFLGGITLFTATVGVLYYIGRATKMFYNHEYLKTAETVEDSGNLDSTSYLGKYYKKCQEFMTDDSKSHPTIYFLKGCCAIVPGVVLGAIPFIPFSLAVLAITLYRLPINFYKTMKIGLFTVLLQWDLKIIALLTLPIIHILFPVVVFVGAIVGSFSHAVFETTTNIYTGDSPFHKWDRFRSGLDDYYKAHQQFVSENCENYDHPTGIPLGWNGTSYGIPIQRILKWQWDFLMMCVFTVYSVPICLLGSTIIVILKYLPMCMFGTVEMTKEYCRGGLVRMLSGWPFYLVGLSLIPGGLLLMASLLVIVSTFMGFGVSVAYIRYGYCAAAYAPLTTLNRFDKLTKHVSFGFIIFHGLQDPNPYYPDVGEPLLDTTGTETNAFGGAEIYWDRFMSQSIKTTEVLMTEKRWICPEHVQTFDPSVVQCIPAVAILTVLIDSVQKDDLDEDDIFWKIDGTVCKREHRPTHDGVTNHLWPMVLELRRLFSANKEELVNAENIERLTAMFCANSDSDTEEVKKYLSQTNLGSNKINSTVRAKITGLVLSILRVKPYQDRMSHIYDYDYSKGVSPQDAVVMDEKGGPSISQ